MATIKHGEYGEPIKYYGKDLVKYDYIRVLDGVAHRQFRRVGRNNWVEISTHKDRDLNYIRKTNHAYKGNRNNLKMTRTPLNDAAVARELNFAAYVGSKITFGKAAKV